MAITFPTYGYNSYGATRSPTCYLYDDAVEDDVIVCFVAATDGAATTDVSGWTNVLGANVEVDPGDGSLCCVMVYHRVTAAEAATPPSPWTITNLWNATEGGTITAVVLRGVATSGELVGAASGSNSSIVTPWVIPSVTPTADYCQPVAGVAGDGSQTQTTPGTHTLRANAAGGPSNYLYSDNDLGTNGVGTGTTDVTPSTADEYVSIVACFKPADDSRPALFTTTRLQAVNRAGSW